MVEKKHAKIEMEDENQEARDPETEKICPFMQNLCNEDRCPMWGKLSGEGGIKLSGCAFTLIGIILLQLVKATYSQSPQINMQDLTKIFTPPQ